MAPRIKLIVVFFTYFGASFETHATFRSVAYRSWSRIGSCLWLDPATGGRTTSRCYAENRSGTDVKSRRPSTSSNTAPQWIVIRDTSCPPSTPRSFRRYLGQVTDNYQCVTKICRQQIETSHSFQNSLQSKWKILLSSWLLFSRWCFLWSVYWRWWCLFWCSLDCLRPFYSKKLVRINSSSWDVFLDSAGYCPIIDPEKLLSLKIGSHAYAWISRGFRSQLQLCDEKCSCFKCSVFSQSKPMSLIVFACLWLCSHVSDCVRMSLLVFACLWLCSHVSDCGARQLSGRRPDSQSREPGFESPFATISKIQGIFFHSIDAPVDSAV